MLCDHLKKAMNGGLFIVVAMVALITIGTGMSKLHVVSFQAVITIGPASKDKNDLLWPMSTLSYWYLGHDGRIKI